MHPVLNEELIRQQLKPICFVPILTPKQSKIEVLNMNKKSVYRQVKITEIKAEDLLNSQRTPREAETVKSPVSSASKNKDAGKD